MDVNIRVKNTQERFLVGDTVSGAIACTLPKDLPIENVVVYFACEGKVKWVEYQGTPYYGLEGNLHYDEIEFHKEMLQLDDIQVVEHADFKTLAIPFAFKIPKDKNLPSTMISTHGSIQYSINVNVTPLGDNPEAKSYKQKLIVQSPVESTNLLVAVCGSAEKTVLLHGGKVALHASLTRKGFAQGDTINVHVVVDNATNVAVIPRVSLHQVQIFTCGSRHKAIENRFPADDSIVGVEVAPGAKKNEQLLAVPIPEAENLTIKSLHISVKYFVEVALAIPHSPDLHVNLPVVITSKDFFAEEEQSKRNRQSEMV